MFNADFYPTPANVIEIMTNGYHIQNKIILEPSAGKGNIVDYLLQNGAKEIIACEKEADLRKILAGKCKVIENDFLQVQSHQVSHIDFIIMNPPFSADEKHILHAYDIAPAGCHIIALCNLNTVKNPHTNIREKLNNIIEANGSYEELEDCFSKAERSTNVKVALVRIQKPGTKSENSDEFDGFFMEEEQEDNTQSGIMPYNVVRDLVNRYVQALKIFTPIHIKTVRSSYFS